MLNNRAVWLLISMLIVGAVLTACGGGEQTSAPPAEETVADQPAANDAEQIEESTASYLLEDGVFTFAMSGEYHPFNYVNETTGELVGFDVEIGQAIAAYHGWEPNPVASPFSGLLSGLRSGNFDAIIGSMGINDERKQVVDFSDPYYYSGAQLFVKKGSAIRSIDDLNDDTAVGVALGTSLSASC